MRRLIWTCIVLLLATLAVLGPVVMIKANVTTSKPAAGGGATVTMANIAFSPRTLTVRKGTSVLFVNKDVAPHTVTSDDRTVDSGTLNPGKAFTVVVEDAFDYVCEIHPSMKASVRLTG